LPKLIAGQPGVIRNGAFRLRQHSAQQNRRANQLFHVTFAHWCHCDHAPSKTFQFNSFLAVYLASSVITLELASVINVLFGTIPNRAFRPRQVPNVGG
jgi:hypothetical protein